MLFTYRKGGRTMGGTGNASKKTSAGKGLDRNTIKWLAMFTMALNHVAVGLMDPSDIWYEVFVDIGFFTAITMCYFLVEGYHYTRSKADYAKRLLICAVMSQLPFYMATGVGGFNMMFTLFCCFMILYIRENVPQPWKETGILLFTIITLVSDWALFAPAFTLMFAEAGKDRKKLAISYGVSAVVFGLFFFLSYSQVYPTHLALFHGFCSSLGMVASGIVILCFYNGQKTRSGRKGSKWAFYLFYPIHLLVIGCLKMFL